MKIYFFLAVIIMATTIIIATFNRNKPNDSGTKIENPTITSTTSKRSVSSSASEVPLPQEEDVIRLFFSLIEERKISDAVMMMSREITENDSTKQAWGVQLNAIKTVKVISIEPSMQEEWKENEHTYKVIIDLTMDPSSASAPIPYYGYDNGQNIRWITLVRSDKTWFVKGIATGP